MTISVTGVGGEYVYIALFSLWAMALTIFLCSLFQRQIDLRSYFINVYQTLISISPFPCPSLFRCLADRSELLAIVAQNIWQYLFIKLSNLPPRVPKLKRLPYAVRWWSRTLFTWDKDSEVLSSSSSVQLKALCLNSFSVYYLFNFVQDFSSKSFVSLKYFLLCCHGSCTFCKHKVRDPNPETKASK